MQRIEGQIETHSNGLKAIEDSSKAALNEQNELKASVASMSQDMDKMKTDITDVKASVNDMSKLLQDLIQRIDFSPDHQKNEC